MLVAVTAPWRGAPGAWAQITTSSSSSSESTTTSSFASNTCTNSALLCLDAASYTSGLLPDQTGSGMAAYLGGTATSASSDGGGSLTFKGNGYLSIASPVTPPGFTFGAFAAYFWLKFNCTPASAFLFSSGRAPGLPAQAAVLQARPPLCC